MKNTFNINSSVWILFGLFVSIQALPQKGQVVTDHSELTGITFPVNATKDNRILSIAAAKTILEMESGTYGIMVSEIEVFAFPNPSGIREDAKKTADELVKSIEQSGYDLLPSVNDPAYNWMKGNNRMILIYLSSTKKEVSLYFGRTDNLPPFRVESGIVSEQNVNPGPDEAMAATDKGGNGSSNIVPIEHGGSPDMNPVSGDLTPLIGNWGMISGSPINYIDDNNYNVVSGVSRGFGLELKGDGTYLQISVVDSGRPSYRINVSTVGTWQVNGNLLVFTPTGRQYRRWEYEMLKTDEHSVPEPYTMIWYLAKNDVSGKDCLYVKYEESQPKWEELCREE